MGRIASQILKGRVCIQVWDEQDLIDSFFFPCLLVLLLLRMYKSKLSQVAFWSVVLSLRYQSLSTNEPYSCLVNYGEPSLCLKHALLKLVLRYP